MEVWKDIRGYEHTHEISSYGNVRIKATGRIMRPSSGKHGHKHVGLRANQISKNFLIHRIVAEAFIPNPHNYPIINHKDENPANNHADNLEWCTHKYNLNYGNAQKRRSHRVSQYDLSGNLIKIWPSSIECRRAGYNQGAVWACCHSAFNRTGNNIYRGFIWQYTDRKIKRTSNFKDKQMQTYSFNKGMREVRHGDAAAVKRELMNGLGIKARQTFAKHRDGRTKEMTVVNKGIIERIFRAYGVDNPWGE